MIIKMQGTQFMDLAEASVWGRFIVVKVHISKEAKIIMCPCGTHIFPDVEKQKETVEQTNKAHNMRICDHLHRENSSTEQ